jgi:hypothetical protein
MEARSADRHSVDVQRSHCNHFDTQRNQAHMRAHMMTHFGSGYGIHECRRLSDADHAMDLAPLAIGNPERLVDQPQVRNWLIDECPMPRINDTD